MTSKEIALSGSIVPAGQGPLEGIPVAPRLGIGGPLDGKAFASTSERLYYRVPTVTVVQDFDTGRIVTAEANADPRLVYIAKTVRVVGVREYRVWAVEKDFDRLDPIGEYEAEVVLVLIDADPYVTRKCLER